jgi:hypothetical protein
LALRYLIAYRIQDELCVVNLLVGVRHFDLSGHSTGCYMKISVSCLRAIGFCSTPLNCCKILSMSASMGYAGYGTSSMRPRLQGSVFT